jgi:predicted solute-binding protein
LTGLPFVFAVWAVQRTGTAERSELAERLRRAKADGLANLEKIVQDGGEFSPEFRREYLTRHVSFDLGAVEKQAIRRFQQYLREMGLIERCHDLRYIR